MALFGVHRKVIDPEGVICRQVIVIDNELHTILSVRYGIFDGYISPIACPCQRFRTIILLDSTAICA